MLNRLLDSVILIDHLNKIPKATKFILGLQPEDTAISVITRAEILVGVSQENRSKVLTLLDHYTTFPIDTNIADIAAELRKAGTPIPQNDIWIAAHSLEHGTDLVSFDKHFEVVTGIMLTRLPM